MYSLSLHVVQSSKMNYCYYHHYHYYYYYMYYYYYYHCYSQFNWHLKKDLLGHVI